jgi:hypothetical protein
MEGNSVASIYRRQRRNLPVGGLIIDAAGNLCGTTVGGGNAGCYGGGGCGVVFEITP